MITNLDENIVKMTGNLQNYKSPGVVRKIRSENASKQDLHSNPLIEIHKMAIIEDSDTRLIQDVTTYPFTITVSFKYSQNCVLSTLKIK